MLVTASGVGASVARASAHAPSTAPGEPTTGPARVVDTDGGGFGTDWYPRAGIPPSEVNSADFGQRFDVTLPKVDGVPPGQIYAEPLISNGVLLVVTEDDNAYGLNPSTGAVEWSRNFGAAWPSSTINCGDLAPTEGVTGTPLIDSSTETAYFVTDASTADGAPQWRMQAIDLGTGKEAAGFPVTIAGTATNDPSTTFDPEYQLQRPGLAMVGNEVFAAFGAQCDESTWYGWMAGVTTSGSLADMWVDETATDDGAGIWGPGGIDIDSGGNLYLATGNGGLPAEGPGLGQSDPPGLGECVVKLTVTDEELSPSDYFCPSDAATLNTFDGDLGSGSPTLLPSSFGTPTEPDLVVQDGKAGEVYLLDRDDLGGYAAGPDGTDDVVSETGPRGGVWSHPAVWPGDGGYVYIVTAGGVGHRSQGGDIDVYERQVTDGRVSLDWVGRSSTLPFGSGIPIVTSSRTDPGSAVVWEIARDSTKTSDNAATLQAFGAVPVPGGAGAAGKLPLLWSASVGNSTKFSEPYTYSGRIYVGNYDGEVLCFGPKRGVPPLSGPAVTAPDTVLGSSSQVTASFTASGPVTVTGISIDASNSASEGAFTSPALTHRRKLLPGHTLDLPVTFSPQVVGGQRAKLTITTDDGTVSVLLTGRGVPEGVPIAASPPSVVFSTQPIGGPAVQSSISFQNTSSSSLTIQSATIESGTDLPFSIGTLPDPLPTVPAGGTFSVPITFTPPGSSGDFTETFRDHVVVSTTAGEATVPIRGSAAPAAQITISSLHVKFGTVADGQSAIASFLVGNRGGIPLTITKSKPPISNGFTAVTSLAEGTVIPAHRTLVETVRFAPASPGRAVATWVINGNDGTGVQTVKLVGYGATEHLVGAPSPSTWRAFGSARIRSTSVGLTGARPDEAGAAWTDRTVAPSDLRASFDVMLTGGSGGDGVTLAISPASGAPGSPPGAGKDGSGLGLGGVPAVAVALQTRPSPGNRDGNSVGIVTSSAGSRSLHWLAEADQTSSLRGHNVAVGLVIAHSTLSVYVDGLFACSAKVDVPASAYLGFTAGTGHNDDRQRVSAVQISY